MRGVGPARVFDHLPGAHLPGADAWQTAAGRAIWTRAARQPGRRPGSAACRRLPGPTRKEAVPCQLTQTPRADAGFSAGPDGRVQRRRIRLRRHAARPGPQARPGGYAAAAGAARLAGYLAYVASFLTIGGAWLLHTALTDQLARADSLFLRLNLLVLLVVVFLPFPTGLVAEYLHKSSDERVYVTLYGLTLLAIRLMGSALDAYARYAHLYSPKGEGEELQSTQRKFLPVVIGYVIAILIGLLLPVAAVALYFGLAVYLVVPFREAARVLARRHSTRQ
jgi:uncharacterized membrane protein